MPLTVHDITIALRGGGVTVLCIEVRDQPIEKGTIVDIGAADTTSGTLAITNVTNSGGLYRLNVTSTTGYSSGNRIWVGGHTGAAKMWGAWVMDLISAGVLDLRNSTFDGSDPWVSGGVIHNISTIYSNRPNPTKGDVLEWSRMIGPSGQIMRFLDTSPQVYLDRTAAVVVANWPTIGGLAVTAVNLKSKPYDSGRSGAGGTPDVVFRHELYVTLNGLLAEGAHAINSMPASIPNTVFTYGFKTTVCKFLHAGSMGHRLADTKKLGYVSGWIPGFPNEGRINPTDYGITDFEVINSAGTQVFTDTVDLLVTPATIEQLGAWTVGNGFTALNGLLHYDSMTQPVLTIVAATKSNPCVLTYSGTDPANGDLMRIKDCGGQTALNGRGITVSNVSIANKTFECIGFNSTGHTGTYQANSGRLHHVFNDGNRNNTYVHGCDYSALTSTPAGMHRLYIPSLGVSNEFPIGEGVHYKTTELCMEGMYHHMCGIACDGRFGYTTTRSFRPEDQAYEPQKINTCYVPYLFSSENGGPIQISVIGDKNLDAGPTPNNIWGGYFDAGDHDRRLSFSNTSPHLLMMDVYEELPALMAVGTRRLPSLSELFDDDTFYDGVDLPDPLKCVIFQFEFYRRSQHPVTGGCLGGQEMNAGIPLFEPGWCNSLRTRTYWYDYNATRQYACAATQISRILGLAGYPTHAAAWQASAVAAYDYSDNFVNNQSFRETECAVLISHMGLASFQGTINNNINSFNDSNKCAAAGNLYRTTKSAVYKAVVENTYNNVNSDPINMRGVGFFNYVRTNDPAIDEGFRTTVINRITGRTASYVNFYNAAGYKNLQFPFFAPFFGNDSGTHQNAGNDGFKQCVWSHILTGNSLYLEMLQANQAHIFGANQLSLSMITGTPRIRSINRLLHADKEALGVDSPSGVAIFGYSHQFPLVTLSFGTSSINFIKGDVPLTQTAGFVQNHIITPHRYGWPQQEFLLEDPQIIEQMEYGPTPGSMAMGAVALYLSSHDGNLTTTLESDAPPPVVPRGGLSRVRLR